MKKKKNRPFGAEQMLRLLIEGFLIGALRKYVIGGYKNEEKDVSNTPAIHGIIKYVDENFLEKITIDELAFLFKTNRSTLCKEFKSCVGKTLINYIAEKKIGLSKQLIKSTDLTFTEISERLHFESVHYFTRFFKKHTGLTPKKYRSDNLAREGF
jgi:AraC-like DNA-binding protein